MDADSLLGEVLSLIEDLLPRFGGVYGIDRQPRHRTEAMMIVFNRLAPGMLPRPQPADLHDDEAVKAMARVAAAIEPSELFVLEREDASPEQQLLHDVANVVLEALAECGQKLEGSSGGGA
jgi:hypothetical protein